MSLYGTNDKKKWKHQFFVFLILLIIIGLNILLIFCFLSHSARTFNYILLFVRKDLTLHKMDILGIFLLTFTSSIRCFPFPPNLLWQYRNMISKPKYLSILTSLLITSLSLISSRPFCM